MTGCQYHSSTEGLLKRITGTFSNFKLEYDISYQRLEISGSIHKYWNGGTNENDFTFYDSCAAIQLVCQELELEPFLAKLVNLEFGVNLTPVFCASTIIDQIICYNYEPPTRPYRLKSNFYFIEFEHTEYYLKIYDKGKQYRGKIAAIGNVLRIEAKAIKSRVLTEAAGIATLADLMDLKKMQVLGVKFAKTVTGILFDYDTLKAKELEIKDRRLYKRLINPRQWEKMKGFTNSSTGNKVRRFKHLVENYGQRKIYSLITGAVNEKILQLTTPKEMAVFTPNYNVKSTTPKYCQSCGRDITHQHSRSKYCSAKYVGYEVAHKCRNYSSNPRNNFKRKIKGIERKGLLFDIMPYLSKVPA